MPSVESLLTSIIHIFNHQRKAKLHSLFQKQVIPDIIRRKPNDSMFIPIVVKYLIQSSSLGLFISHIHQTEWNQFYKKTAIMVIPENVLLNYPSFIYSARKLFIYVDISMEFSFLFYQIHLVLVLLPPLYPDLE